MKRLRNFLPVVVVLVLGAACVVLVLRTGAAPEPPPMRRQAVETPADPGTDPAPQWDEWKPRDPAPPQDVPAPVAAPEVLPEADGVKGRVFDERGAPVADAAIYINRRQLDSDLPADAVSGSDGRFVLTQIPESGFRLTAYHDEHPPGYETVATRGLGDREIRIVLYDGGAVAGQVTLGGRPLEGAAVSLGPVGGQYRKVLTDTQGRYRIGGIAPGRYDIVARDTTGGDSVLEQHTSRQVNIVVTRTVTQDFKLAGGTSGLKGTIRVDGKPALRSRINGVVTVANGEREIFNLDVTGGEYLMDALPAGRFNFNVHVLDYAGLDKAVPGGAATDSLRRSESADLIAGQVETRDFEFFPAVGVRGTVSGIGPDDRASVLVFEGYREITEWRLDTFLTLAAEKIRSQRVENNIFTIADLPPRDYTLLGYIEPKDVTGDPDAIVENLRMDMLYIQLAPGEMQQLQLDLR